MELLQQIVGWVLALAGLVLVPYWTYRVILWWVVARRTVYVRPARRRRRR